MFKKLKKFFYLYILKRKYYRVGQCNACGRCCQKIYVKHKDVIQTEKDLCLYIDTNPQDWIQRHKSSLDQIRKQTNVKFTKNALVYVVDILKKNYF